MDQTEAAPGVTEMNSLQQGGFTGTEIDQWRANTTKALQDGGFSSKEVDDYFGEKTPDLSKTQANFKSNIEAKRAADAAKTTTAQPPPEGGNPQPHQAGSFVEAIEAGFDMSVSGLIAKGKPATILPEQAPMYYRIASQVGQLAGDVPAMIAGSFAGGAAGAAVGSAVPIVGTAAGAVVGASAGAFALPEAMRTTMMQHYEKGDVKSFGDFWERASAVAINTLKAGAIGGVTAGVGGAAEKVLAGAVLPTAVKTTAQLAAEVGTMTTVGSALEGKMPEPQDFLDAAVLVGGLHGAGMASSKIRSTFAKAGVKPEEVFQKAQVDGFTHQEVLAENVPVPMGGEFGVRNPTPPENFPTIKPLKEPNPEFSPEVNTILSKVTQKGERTKKSITASELYTNFVDKLDPINEATKVLTDNKVDLPAEENPYILAREAVDAKAKAKHFFEKGTLDYDTLSIKGDSLKSALTSVESPEVLDAYMVSKRVIEKEAQFAAERKAKGEPEFDREAFNKMDPANQALAKAAMPHVKTTGFDVEAAKKVVTEHAGKYEAAAQKVTKFSNDVLDYVTKAGVLSEDQAANFKEANKDYVPFKRIIDESDAVGSKKGGGKAGSLKEFKGSERDIQSPITSVMENTVELIKMAETNRPKVALVELAEKSKDQDLIKKLRTPVQEIEVSKEEVARQLKISPEAADTVSTFRAIRKDLAPDQFSVYRDGKREVYQTTPELAAAISKLGGDSTSRGLLFKLASNLTAFKKLGITFTPEFITKNAIRDWFTGSTFSADKKGINPMDVLGAMGDVWKKNDVYYDWLKSGGANGSFLELDEAYIKKDIYKLQEETNFMGSVRNLVSKPVDFMRLGAELSEQALRVAEFKKVREAGGSHFAAGFASREITVDFQRIGAKMSALNAITAFQNVAIQGADRTVRAIKNDPLGVMTKGVASMTVPTLLLWWANKDDQRVQELPRWERDTHWIIAMHNWKDATDKEAQDLPDYMVRNQNGKIQIDKGNIYRIPRPQELGLMFAALPERVMDAMFSAHPDTFKDFGQTITSLLLPSFVPDALAPAVEQYFNKSFFTGNAVVPAHLNDQIPQYQYTDYTSDTAKALGKMIGKFNPDVGIASPMVLDNYIQSWGGSLGKYGVQILDKAAQKAGLTADTKPAGTISDIPFVKSFVARYPLAGTKSVSDFYDTYESATKVVNTVEALQKAGNVEEAQKLMNERGAEFFVGKEAMGAKAAFSAQSEWIRKINKDPEMSKDEKRQLIDTAYLQMTTYARQMNEMIANTKKAVEENKGK